MDNYNYNQNMYNPNNYNQNMYNPNNYNQNNYNPNNPNQEGKGLSIACMVCGICSIVICGIIGLICGICAIVFYFMLKNKGIAVNKMMKAGFICGIVGCSISVLWLVGFVLNIMFGSTSNFLYRQIMSDMI